MTKIQVKMTFVIIVNDCESNMTTLFVYLYKFVCLGYNW